MSKSGITNILVIILSLVFVGMSALMLFVEGVDITYLCYAICSAAIVAGIYLIVRYFLTDAYRNVNAYGFSLGTLLVILGVCGMVRAAQMAGAFIVILGIILLLSGIIVLQHSLDLRRMEDVVWIFIAVISAIILICSIMVIIEPLPDKIPYGIAVWWMMLIAGSIGVIINIYTMVRVSLYNRKEKKEQTLSTEKESNNSIADEAITKDSSESEKVEQTNTETTVETEEINTDGDI